MYLISFVPCPSGSSMSDCLGPELLVRFGLGLFFFHFLLFVLILPKNYVAKVINESCFFVKFVLICGFILGFLYLEPNLLKMVVTIANYTSIVFSVFLIISLIDVAYLVNEFLVIRFHNGNKFIGIMLVFSSLLLCVLNSFMMFHHIQNFWTSSKFLCTNNFVNISFIKLTSIILVNNPKTPFLKKLYSFCF